MSSAKNKPCPCPNSCICWDSYDRPGLVLGCRCTGLHVRPSGCRYRDYVDGWVTRWPGVDGAVMVCLTGTWRLTPPSRKGLARHVPVNRRVAGQRLVDALALADAAHRHAETNVVRAGSFGSTRSFTWPGWRDQVRSSDGRSTGMRQALAGRLGPLVGH